MKAGYHSGWWKELRTRNRKLIWLLQAVRVDRAELIRLAAPFRRFESKATKKGHIHKHRDCGSKRLKKHNRIAWNRLYRA